MSRIKCLVVSAVNFTEGGPLSVLIASLDAASEFLGDEWEIIALVHNATLIKNTRVKFFEFPDSKKSWRKRLLLEWFEFKCLSEKLKPDLWVSLHDITPRIQARRQIVYCHNPAPFYKVTWREGILDPKFLLFNWFYKYLYRVNIHRNYAVVVQQDWMRSAFFRLYGNLNIVVAHPMKSNMSLVSPIKSTKTVFLYPAFPRVFKNIEVLCKAAEMLPLEMQAAIEIRLTIDGTENKYSRSLVRRYGGVSALHFMGKQSQDDMTVHYAQCDVVLFPSRLETWGLPISEGKSFGKQLLLADLPYAHESVGTYANVSFLQPNDATAWARAIEGIATGKWVHSGNIATLPSDPYVADWSQLWALLILGL